MRNNNKEEFNMKNKNKVRQLVILGLLTAILLIMAYTPLGYLNIGPLAVTFNVIPVAVAAFALGPVGGAIIGGMFGLTSFLQCFGGSALGTALFAVNPALTVIQCFVPRILDGLIIGAICNFLKKKGAPSPVSSAVTGFCAAFFNTLLYMSSLILLFGNTELIQNYREQLAPGKNVFLFVCAFVGINAVAEMISSTIISGAVGTALAKAKLVEIPGKKEKAAA